MTPRAATRLAKAETFLAQLSKVSAEAAPVAAIQLRLVSDYDDQAVPTATDALDLGRVAIGFVSYCRSLIQP